MPGSLNHAAAVDSSGGDQLTFAYIINNPLSPEQDALRGQLGALLASYPDRPPLADLLPVEVPGQGGRDTGGGSTTTTAPADGGSSATTSTVAPGPGAG
jgi:hypothetical protein